MYEKINGFIVGMVTTYMIRGTYWFLQLSYTFIFSCGNRLRTTTVVRSRGGGRYKKTGEYTKLKLSIIQCILKIQKQIWRHSQLYCLLTRISPLWLQWHNTLYISCHTMHTVCLSGPCNGANIASFTTNMHARSLIIAQVTMMLDNSRTMNQQCNRTATAHIKFIIDESWCLPTAMTSCVYFTHGTNKKKLWNGN